MSHEVASAASLQRTHAWHVALLVNSVYHDESKNLPGARNDAKQLENCDSSVRLHPKSVGTN